jgi:hypothetical protein
MVSHKVHFDMKGKVLCQTQRDFEKNQTTKNWRKVTCFNCAIILQYRNRIRRILL